MFIILRKIVILHYFAIKSDEMSDFTHTHTHTHARLTTKRARVRVLGAARQMGKPLNVYLAPVHPHSSK